MTLKDKLTALCESRRWERYDLLDVVGDVSKSTIDNWFRGKHKPGLVAALRIAREFGVPLEYLADDAQDEPARGPGLTADEERSLWLIREVGLTSGDLARRLIGPGGEGRVDVLPTLKDVDRSGELRREEARRSGPEPEPDRERSMKGNDIPTFRGE